MDITALPKEVLFDLLLKVEPHEIDIVCRSKNSRVRAICSSKLFQQAYKKKYPKKLMTGKISMSTSNNFYIFIDEKENEIVIEHENGEIYSIEYTPFKQLYPSTYVKSISELSDFFIDEDSLRMNNPLIISMQKYKNNYILRMGREYLYGVRMNDDEKIFLDSYNSEVKEFLDYIERRNWYSPDIKYRSSASEKSMKEFNSEIIDILKDVKIGNKKVWQVIKPLNF